MLIKYDLSQGGTKPTFGLHRWITQGNAAQDCQASAKLPCWGKVKPLGAEAVGSVNTAAVTDPIKGVVAVRRARSARPRSTSPPPASSIPPSASRSARRT